MRKKVLIPLADGFDELEVFSAIEILTKAGVEVIASGIRGSQVSGMHGSMVFTHKTLGMRPEDFSAVIIPGGSLNYITALTNSADTIALIQRMHQAGKYICAIENSALVLQKIGIITDGVRVSVHPSLERKFSNPRNGKVVIDKNIITSPDPMSSIQMSLKLAELLVGDVEAQRVHAQINTKLFEV
jgi:protein deglycase